MDKEKLVEEIEKLIPHCTSSRASYVRENLERLIRSSKVSPHPTNADYYFFLKERVFGVGRKEKENSLFCYDITKQYPIVHLVNGWES